MIFSGYVSEFSRVYGLGFLESFVTFSENYPHRDLSTYALKDLWLAWNEGMDPHSSPYRTTLISPIATPYGIYNHI